FDYNGNYYQIMELPGGEVSARVYPNPGQDYFTLKCYENFSGADLLLHDMAGHKVIQQKITSPTMEIITTDLLPGTYIYSIQKNGKTVFSGKWVKR
ncbi:MAG: T9SS type A sorting domain-containing protein, partial [Bacteroidota bacterium]|nr:T9SS type A sorting domain-containing protein [Bacteroidota bacterium]